MAVGDSNVSAIAQFPKDPTMPAQILGASVVGSDGQSSDRYDVFDQIELRVLYVIREPLEGVAAGLGVERNAERLFVSFDTDNHPQRLDCREPGFYSASVRFPTPLKSGRYTVNLSLCKPNGYGIDDRQNALAFDVEDLSFDTSMRSYGASRPGVMAVHLNWQTHRIDSKDEPVTRSRLMT
jgi:hypothetical protein